MKQLLIARRRLTATLEARRRRAPEPAASAAGDEERNEGARDYVQDDDETESNGDATVREMRETELQGEREREIRRGGKNLRR